MTKNNQLMVKEVNFNGTNLMACKSNEDGKVYVGISYICNGLGLSKSQKDNQVQKIQNDKTLRKGCLKFQGGVFDPNNETLAIELEFLPLWLAKINITPTIEKENPKLADILEDYQLKAKDVLAKAFIEKSNTALDTYLDMSEEDRAIAYFTKSKENKQLQLQLESVNEVIEELKPKAEFADKVEISVNTIDVKTFSDLLGIPKLGQNNMFKWLRNQEYLTNDNEPYRRYIEQGLFETKESTYNTPFGIKTSIKPLITGKGQIYLEKKIREYIEIK